MSSGLNKEWINLDKIDNPKYQSGILDFSKFLLEKDGVENASANRKKLYSCPCRSCCNKKDLPFDDVVAHLFDFGMDKSYTTWYYHGENLSSRTIDASTPLSPIEIPDDEFDQSSFPSPNPISDEFDHEGTSTCVSNPRVASGENKESKYECLKRLAKQPLFSLTQKSSLLSQHSTMDALLKVNDLKRDFNLSNGATEGVLKLIKELLPVENALGSTYHEMKCTLKEAELTCVSYDVCINNCMLFWKEHADSSHCTKCQEPRYTETVVGKNSKDIGRSKRKRTAVHVPKIKLVARKVMKYFPVIPRLKRLYGIKWIAEAMKWHAQAEFSNEFMRHPRDSSEWRNVNRKWKSFDSNPQSVRFALAIDGFQPYGQFGASYSCWPVILQPLNLPPSLTMNSEFSMLTVLIPGKRAPKGAEVDVFLQPLVEEMNILWKGVDDVWDADEKIPFKLMAMILWCIHDFPAYGLLAGCSHSGHEACPICSAHTPSLYLDFSRKCCYLRSRIFLLKDHPFRYNTSTETFNGEVEHGIPSPRLEGKQVERITSRIGNVCSTSTPNDAADGGGGENGDNLGSISTKGFSRKSSLFDLPYWTTHTIRHNLDIMHIEKNVMETILSTILSLKGTKDTRGAREDLEHLGLKKSLWMKLGEDGETKTPPTAPYVLSSDEKSRFFNALNKITVPSRFSANFRNSVHTDSETFSFKSHDYHVIIEHLLPALLMDAYPSTERLLFTALQRISIFFNVLCAKVVSREHLNKAKLALTEAICVLETYFPPSFFVSMIHLMHHLGDEALIAGPSRYRSMWSFERQINKYKRWARNKRYIEGSIAEQYLSYEASLYAMEFKGAHKKYNGDFWDSEDPADWGQHVGVAVKTVLNTTQMVQARKWVLQQQPDYDDWRRQYDETGRCTIESAWKYEVDDFIIWLQEKAQTEGDLQMQRISQGPDFDVDSYNQFQCNGYMFSTIGYEANKQAQNSGVSMKAYNSNGVMTTYYGVIQGIFDLDYGDHSITVFYCDWVDSDDRNAFKVHPLSKLVMVNLSKTMPSDNINAEPFILASQARQIFYCDASKEEGWSVVIPSPKRLTKEVDALVVDHTMYNSVLEENERLCDLLLPFDGSALKRKYTRRRA